MDTRIGELHSSALNPPFSKPALDHKIISQWLAPLGFPDVAHKPDADLSRIVKDGRVKYPVADTVFQALDTQVRAALRALCLAEHFTMAINREVEEGNRTGSLSFLALRSTGDSVADCLGMLADSLSWLLGSILRIRRVGFLEGSPVDPLIFTRLMALPWSQEFLFCGRLEEFLRQGAQMRADLKPFYSAPNRPVSRRDRPRLRLSQDSLRRVQMFYDKTEAPSPAATKVRVSNKDQPFRGKGRGRGRK